MSDWYELIGQTPVKIDGDIIECAIRFEAMNRKIALTTVLGMCQVSTIFLGLDHSFLREGPPVLFETMVFWRGESGYEQERCSTWLEAEKQHARMCREAARPPAVLAYVRRRLADEWDRAKSDMGHRWRDLRGIEPGEMDAMIERLDACRLNREIW